MPKKMMMIDFPLTLMADISQNQSDNYFPYFHDLFQQQYNQVMAPT